VTDHRASPTPLVEAALVVAAFVGLTLVVTFPLVLRLPSHLPHDLGDPVLNAWILAWGAVRMRAGFTGIWDAPALFPYPHALAYSENLFGIAVFTAPIQWLTANPVLCYNLAFIGSFVLAGCGMYVLARSLTGRRDAAFVAGLIYAFTPYRTAQIAHLQMLMSGWIPLSLWALHRYIATRRWALLWASAACVLLQSLSNGYFIYFGALPLAIVGVAEIWRTRPPAVRTFIHVSAVVAALLAALAPVAVAYYSVRHGQGLRRTGEIALYSADLSDYFHGHQGIWLWRRFGTASGEHELFPGFVLLLLAAAAVPGLIARRFPSRIVVLYGIVAAAAMVLSFGPEPRAWGHRLPVAGPYHWMLHIVPGLDGLRAVARLDMIVIVGLCVMAAVGAGRLLDRVRSGQRWSAVAIMATLILAESWMAPLPAPRFDPAGDPLDADAYEYLRRSPPGGVLEMPTSFENLEREVRYQYMTLVHRHPVVNGHTGYQTPLLTFLQSGHSPFKERAQLAAAIEMMRAIGVRYLLVHPDDFENRAQGDALIIAVEAERRQVIATRRFARTIVAALMPYEMEPGIEPSARVIPSSVMRARASHEPDRVDLMFDGNKDTRWLTGERQSAHEWIELELDRPRNVAGVRIQLGERSFADYPRELAIEIVDERELRTVFRGSVLPRLGRAMLRDSYPAIDLPLPPNHARTVRLRQVGEAEQSSWWSIHELTLFER
jgi:hypothetical protein